MNFVQTLEESLRDLAAEARKRHPGVKEASERATLRLRHLQTQYVSQVRHANASADIEHPTTRLFRNSEILHPFLLAANYPNASAELLEISFQAMRLLMEADAIHASDAIQMLRVWMIQAQAVVAYFQKVFAKDILLQEQQAERMMTQQSTTTSAATGSASSSSSSSWFSWGASSSTSAAATTADSSSSSSKHGSALVQATKSATTSSQQSPLQMEHRAKQILSCLLQLLENLKQQEHTGNTELWTNATALACVWLHYTPLRHTVHQAARSTLRQVMTLLFATTATTMANDKLLLSTWDDLLQLADTSKLSSSNLAGAFLLCKRNAAQTVTVYAPTPELALELLVQVLRDRNKATATSLNFTLFITNMPTKLLQKTMGMTVQLLFLLQNNHKRASLTMSLRVMQWTCALFQTYSQTYSSECRELFALLFKPIAAATEACRSHDDFEDGFVYENHNDGSSDTTTSAAAADDNVKRSRLVTLIPPCTLWKAAFALEAIHHVLDRDDPTELLVLLEDERIVMGLSETLSDFATIGASCMDHILQLVNFGKSLPYTGTEVFAKTSVKIKPTFFRKAEQACTSGNAQSLLADTLTSKSTDKPSSSGSSTSPGILGEALWISLQNLLRISECMNGLNGVDEMLEQTFAPSLAVLQHYLKRCIGSTDLVQLSLKGYANLADVCLPMSVLHRKALLLSLCKLSLPRWGRRDASCQLQDHHVLTLLYLCRIIHTHYESITEEWEIIVRTLDELSIISIASKQLSDGSYHAALALSILFSRLAPFTTCFSSVSLLKLAAALAEVTKSRLVGLDIVGNNDTILVQRVTPMDSLARQTSSDGVDASISSKIMNMGARAIYGSGSETEKQADFNTSDRTSIMFYEDYRREFVKRLSSAKSSVRVTSIGDIPYVLAVLVDIAMVNSFRFKECGDQLSEQLSSLASISPAVRPFVMDILSMLAMSHLSNDRLLPAPFVGPGRLIFVDPMQSQLWAVEGCGDALDLGQQGDTASEPATKSQSDLLAPLCLKIRSADKPDMAESSLGALSSILEGVGHNMAGDVWCHVIDAVASLSGDPRYTVVNRTSALWSSSSSLGFRCLKFIVDDFRDQLTRSEAAAKTLTSLLDCCSSFGRSEHDVNISLTAITLLWTIADQDPGSDSIDRALSRLVDLASDMRAEVRNAAVNTIFSCIVGRGGSFTPIRWEFCFADAIFGVYDMVAIKASLGDSDANGGQCKEKRYRVSLHHSRDSNQKLWLETQTLVLRGLNRLLRNFFAQLLQTTEQSNPTEKGTLGGDTPWFQDAWAKILDYSLEAATHDGGRDTVAIRTVGAELMVLCCQLSSDAGIEASIAPARVGTNMEVVNGALRTVRNMQPTKAIFDRAYSEATKMRRMQLYQEGFEAIEIYSDTVTKAIKQGGTADDTLVQVIHSFTTALCHLYDCSKASELAPQGSRVRRSLEHADGIVDRNAILNDLESRFVGIITAMLAAAGGYSTSRYLNQGQRSSLNLLRSMSSNGSAVAFDELIVLAGSSLFYQKCDAVSGNGGKSQLSHEAADAVTEGVAKDTVSSACKAFVLLRVVCALLQLHQADHVAATSRHLNYTNFLLILVAGLAGLNQLPLDDSFGSKATELVWENLTKCLSQLLSPTTAEDGALRIECISDLLKIITTIGESVPQTQASNLCTVLSFGASKALSVARFHNKHLQQADADDGATETNEDDRAALLDLFQLCYSFCCRLHPNDQALKSITKDALSSAISSNSDESVIDTDLKERVALIVCRCLQSDQLESLVISVFAQLSRLATARSMSIRDAVSDVFDVIDVATILESARTKCEVSETKALSAESRVKELTAKIKQLQQRNVELTQEVAILQASSAM